MKNIDIYLTDDPDGDRIYVSRTPPPADAARVNSKGNPIRFFVVHVFIPDPPEQPPTRALPYDAEEITP